MVHHARCEPGDCTRGLRQQTLAESYHMVLTRKVNSMKNRRKLVTGRPWVQARITIAEYYKNKAHFLVSRQPYEVSTQNCGYRIIFITIDSEATGMQCEEEWAAG